MENLIGRAGNRAVNEARDLIGRVLRHEPFNTEATRPAINRFVKAIGDRNPLFLDEGHAGKTRYGGLVAPPCWLYTVHSTLVAPKLAGFHAIYGGTEWEFHRPIRLGDRVSARARLLEVVEKESQFCGQMILQRGEVQYLDQTGELLARAISDVLRTPRQAAIERGKYDTMSRYRYQQHELLAIENDYDVEEIRGSNPRYWEEIAEGEALRPVVKGPLTSEDMVQFIGASCPIPAFERFHEMYRRHPDIGFLDPRTNTPRAWEASLIEKEPARLFGFPDAHDCGIDRISWIGSMLTNWMGDDGSLKKLAVRLLRPNIYRDTTWCKASVSKKYEEGKERLVQCRVWAENQRGQMTAEGTAVISLPTYS